MVAKRIYITLPDDLYVRVMKHNKKHPEKPISFSGACKKAIEEVLETYEED